ncbi:type II secretion system protein GspG [bacterium]|nr:type II secretion system protein GspG [bacterium]
MNFLHKTSPRSLTSIYSSRGMTLVEIMVVIVLISLVFGIVAKGVFGKSDAAKVKLNATKMEKLKSDIELFRTEYGRYPGSLQELIKGSSEIQKSGKIFVALTDEDSLFDVYGTPYQYETQNNNRTFRLKSLGADGAEGGEGTNQDATVQP